MSSDQLERGLHASVNIYNFAQSKLAELAGEPAEAATDCVVSREELVGVKKSAAAMNRALTALVRDSHASENRLTLELHMLRGIMQREHTDRDAHRARAFELFRRYNGGDDVALSSVPATTSTASSNPLNAPSASAVAIDRALASLERVEQSVRDLSPVGLVNIYGAGLLSASLRMQPASAIKKRHRRAKPPVVTESAV